jgi:hypothetical protein
LKDILINSPLYSPSTRGKNYKLLIKIRKTSQQTLHHMGFGGEKTKKKHKTKTNIRTAGGVRSPQNFFCSFSLSRVREGWGESWLQKVRM